MSGIINSENYEAFYLDYLEGNLNEADSAALLLFLAEHPELQLEDESLPLLADENAVLASDFKNELRVFDETETINEANAELFLIASVENLLSESKKTELGHYLEQHPDAKADANLYALTRLKADTSVAYPEKTGLKKQARVIPIFWRSAAIAASLTGIIALSYWLPSDSMAPNVSTYTAASFVPGKISLTAKSDIIQKPVIEQHTSGTAQRHKKTDSSISVSRLALKKASPITTAYAKDIAHLNLPASQPVRNSSPKAMNTAFISVADMKNPIKPITEGITTRFNKEVELRTAKASKNKQGGFYLKIGRFEFSRKTAPIDGTIAAN